MTDTFLKHYAHKIVLDEERNDQDIRLFLAPSTTRYAPLSGENSTEYIAMHLDLDQQWTETSAGVLQVYLYPLQYAFYRAFDASNKNLEQDSMYDTLCAVPDILSAIIPSSEPLPTSVRLHIRKIFGSEWDLGLDAHVGHYSRQSHALRAPWDKCVLAAFEPIGKPHLQKNENV